MPANISQALSRINAIAKRAVSLPSDIDNDVQLFFLTRAREMYRTQGRSGDSPWQDYSGEPKYRAYKQAITGDARLLRWSPGRERLYPSLVANRHPDRVFERRGNKYTFGTRVPWADDIERGGRGPFGEPYPRRKVIAMSRGDEDLYARIIKRVILDGEVPPSLWRARR